MFFRHCSNILRHRRATVWTHQHERNIDVPVYCICRRPPPRIPWQRQGVQCHQSIRLHGHDLAAGQNQFLREASIRLLENAHQPERLFAQSHVSCRPLSSSHFHFNSSSSFKPAEHKTCYCSFICNSTVIIYCMAIT